MKAKLDTDLNAEDLKVIIEDYKKLVKKDTGKDFPQDPFQQLMLSRDAVFNSWNTPKAIYYRQDGKDSGFDRHRGQCAGDGVRQYGRQLPAQVLASLAIPSTGEKIFYGEFLVNAQGEDVVAGIRTPQPIEELKQVMPAGVCSASRNHDQP